MIEVNLVKTNPNEEYDLKVQLVDTAYYFENEVNLTVEEAKELKRALDELL